MVMDASNILVADFGIVKESPSKMLIISKQIPIFNVFKYIMVTIF
jgi:hypothetical protein